MKKPTIIIGKKQIIMTCLTLMLAIAVYINYTTTPTKFKKDGESVKVAEMGDTVNYGDTEFVNASPEDSEAKQVDYFAQARLDRMNGRDEAVQTLQTIIGGGDLTEDEMVVNALDAVVTLFNGVNAFRQQMPEFCRIHGVVTNGGVMPNIIPAEASFRFYLRRAD